MICPYCHKHTKDMPDHLGKKLECAKAHSVSLLADFRRVVSSQRKSKNEGVIMSKVDENNIEYTVFQNANGKYCVSSRDLDSGEIITLRICESETQAISIHNGK